MTWSTDDVPIAASGSPSFHISINSIETVSAQAVSLAANDNGTSTGARELEFTVSQPPKVGIKSYTGYTSISTSRSSDPCYGLPPHSSWIHDTIAWDKDSGGKWLYDEWASGSDQGGTVHHADLDSGDGAISPVWEIAETPFATATQNSCFSETWKGYRQTQTRVVIEPRQNSPVGSSIIYRVRACAKRLSDPATLAQQCSYIEMTEGNQASFCYGDVPISPESLTIQGQYLTNTGVVNDDGSTWGEMTLVAPAGAEIDVTPQWARPIGFNDYSFDVQVEEAPIQILANGVDISTNTPEFCVGQQVTFTLSGLPQFANQVSRWTLPGKIVNEQYSYSANCTSYDLNPDLLNGLTNSCWFVNTPGGTVSVDACLLLSTGQIIHIVKKGSISLYRPTVTITTNCLPNHYVIASTLGPTCKLQLGDDSGDGGIKYFLGIDTKLPFSGVANITQLITADYSNPLYQFSEERCDGPEFYNTSDATVITHGVTGLDDGPYGWWTTPNIVSLSARDFIRFKPEGGIFVTLGVISWQTIGTGQQDIWGQWSVTTDTTSPLTGPDGSCEFPVWMNTVKAH